jgi:PIN domain nuclease of toxin-antitoxin system
MPRAPRKRRAATAVREARTSVSFPGARRLLLDTHVWLWWQIDDRRLGESARKAIASAPEVRLSAASVWEIAIKSALGKLTLPRGADILEELDRDGFMPLAVEVEHAARLRELPLLHRDPFDRMLISQALSEGLTLVTADPQLEGYGVTLVDAAK